MEMIGLSLGLTTRNLLNIKALDRDVKIVFLLESYMFKENTTYYVGGEVCWNIISTIELKWIAVTNWY